MQKGLIDLCINTLICARTPFVMSDKQNDKRYIKEIDKLIKRLQELKYE